MTTTLHRHGIARRENGLPPPDVPLSDVDLGSLELYQSETLSEARFADPWLFDVTRERNPHVGYGGGAHFCLGANLARREIRVLFEELHRQTPDIVATEEPAILHSALLHGIKRLPVAWGVPD